MHLTFLIPSLYKPNHKSHSVWASALFCTWTSHQTISQTHDLLGTSRLWENKGDPDQLIKTQHAFYEPVQGHKAAGYCTILPNTTWISCHFILLVLCFFAGSTTAPCPGSCGASPPSPCWCTSLVHRLNSCRRCGGMRQQWTSWQSCWAKTHIFRTTGVCGTTVSPSTCTRTSGSQLRCTTKSLASKVNLEFIYLFI